MTQWQDAKGFGFITPNGGDERVFFHIRSLPRSSGRPRLHDRVNYTVERDPQGRPRAVRVQFAGTREAPLPRRDTRPALFVLTAAFAAVLVALLAAGALPGPIAAVYAVASAATVCAYAVDKWAASAGRSRIPERTLHLLALAGGWPAGFVAQHAFRHKYRKPAFVRVFWACAGANVAMALWLLLSSSGQDLVRALSPVAG